VGLVGANGSGKTTLLRILNGEIAADSGTVERADALRVVYFDQNRRQLDPAASLRKALSPDGDSVIYRDSVVHVAGWAKRFLFRPEQLETAVGRLSGGEQARVLIAQLMLQPADLLLLDEPTNDLDISTLEVLEENLLDFPGALVLVTHDRYLLDRVVTGVLGLDGEGGVELFADYSQWEAAQSVRRKPKAAVKATEPQAGAGSKKRLSYLDSREWESMEEKILHAEQALEQKKAEVQKAAADAIRLQVCYAEMLAAQEEVDRLYTRWAELEAKLQGA
jgi:ATP-binding cassette subfamily F protein uup